VLLRGAEVARQRGAFALEAMLLHDVVRFGGTPKVVERLGELVSSVQGPLIAARAEHATGVVAADGGRLGSAVDRFEQIGSPLLAAEAALDLGDVEAAGGSADRAQQARERAARLLTGLDASVVTPRLRSPG
jgi:hypothetical protein